MLSLLDPGAWGREGGRCSSRLDKQTEKVQMDAVFADVKSSDVPNGRDSKVPLVNKGFKSHECPLAAWWGRLGKGVGGPQQDFEREWEGHNF